MKAVRYHSYGDSDVLVYEEADRPVAGAGQVVVQVAGTAFNLLDAAIRAGLLQDVFPVALPHIPNYDASRRHHRGRRGRAAAGASGTPSWRSCRPTAPGAAAEYVAAPAEALATAPRTGELVDAAALPSVGLTAWQSLFEHAGLKTGPERPDRRRRRRGGRVRRPARRAGRCHRDRDRQRAQPRPHPLLRRRADRRLRRYTDRTGAGRAAVRRGAAPGAHARPGTHQPGRNRAARGSGRRRRSLRQHHHSRPRGCRARVRTVRVFVRSDAAQLAELVARVDTGLCRSTWPSGGRWPTWPPFTTRPPPDGWPARPS